MNRSRAFAIAIKLLRGMWLKSKYDAKHEPNDEISDRMKAESEEYRKAMLYLEDESQKDE